MKADRSWTAHEIERLRQMYLAKASEREIAIALGRSKDSVGSRRAWLIKKGRLIARTPMERHRIQQRATIAAVARRRGERLPNDALDHPGRVSSDPALCSIPLGAGSPV